MSPDQSQLMDIVLRESDRLNDTIRNFLAYADLSAAVVDMDVRRVITDTARLLENSAEVPRPIASRSTCRPSRSSIGATRHR